MNKSSLILKYFQKSDQLTVGNKEYQQIISSLFRWLTDIDKVTDDKTTKYFPNITCQAKIIAKQEGIIAGIEEVEFLLKKYTTLSFKSLLNDGLQFKNGTGIAEIKGKSHQILAYERAILNILMRMSGIATETNRLINLIQNTPSRSHFVTPGRWPNGLLPGEDHPYLAATRKTPWMSLDKKAVAAGGGLTHRLNLSDGILIKDNHLALLSIEDALNHLGGGKLKAPKTPGRWQGGKNTSEVAPIKSGDSSDGEGFSKQLIEIEVENFQQAHQAIKTFQSRKDTWKVAAGLLPAHLAILFDNLTPSRVKTLLSNLSNLYDLSSIIFEASGGIDEKNISDWSQTGVDIISLGSLTHSPKAINLSLEIIL